MSGTILGLAAEFFQSTQLLLLKAAYKPFERLSILDPLRVAYLAFDLPTPKSLQALHTVNFVLGTIQTPASCAAVAVDLDRCRYVCGSSDLV